jgi:hypothetical protein
MFNDMKMEILNSIGLTVIKTIYVDVQPHMKNVSFEDGYTLEIAYRAFCEKDDQLSLARYVRIENQIYIVLDLKEWSDYVELFLYRCKSDFS